MATEMTEVRGVLWDLDGVLVDTGEAHFDSWRQVLSERDVPFSREDFARTFGMNNAGLLALLLGGKLTAEEVQVISNRKEVLFRQMVKGNAHLLPGVITWLARLKSEGVRQAIASSAPQENIDVLVDELALRDYFEAIVSGAALSGKPDPAVFLEAARRIGAPPAACVVVEDAIAGVQAARNAGMRCIAVTTTHPREQLFEADRVVDSLAQLTVEDFINMLD